MATMQLFGRKKANKYNGSQSSTGVLARSGPGATAVASNAAVFRVVVPDFVDPGGEFQVFAGSRIVRVRCPPGCRPGDALQITIPSQSEAVTSRQEPSRHRRPRSTGAEASPDSPNGSLDAGNSAQLRNGEHLVSVPDGVSGGELFPVTIDGREVIVTCPENANAGSLVRIHTAMDRTARPPDGPGVERSFLSEGDVTVLTYEVQVPDGVQPGAPFALIAGGVRIMVYCPNNATPGQRIRFKVPVKGAASQKKIGIHSTDEIKLRYNQEEWQRVVRVSDMKFQWVRLDEEGRIEYSDRFDIKRSAYVRNITYNKSDDLRLQTGQLSLVSIAHGAVASSIQSRDGLHVVTFSDIARVQSQSFNKKVMWFRDVCAKVTVPWEEGHMRVNIRRERVIEDSVDAIMSLSRRDLRKVWRFDFLQEAGLDAGGLTREWFRVVSNLLFDPAMGLFVSSSTNQMKMEINPGSGICCEDHLTYFRFLGRLLGKALFGGHVVNGHMAHYLFKHLLGWPVAFRDLAMIDEESYNNLKYLETMAARGDDISLLCLNFTATEDFMGQKREAELVANGATIDVTNENFLEYLEARLRYRLLDRVRPQLSELLLGFFDIIPEPLLTVFDYKELELVMCGLSEINVDDWKRNTEYSGLFDVVGGNDRVCQWFWEVVARFDHETKARLLQFITGSAGVPSGGFAALQGNDGNIRKFSIQGVSLSTCLYPRAHTCFNRIDLPLYETKEDLLEKLTVAMTITDFDLE